MSVVRYRRKSGEWRVGEGKGEEKEGGRDWSDRWWRRESEGLEEKERKGDENKKRGG